MVRRGGGPPLPSPSQQTRTDGSEMMVSQAAAAAAANKINHNNASQKRPPSSSGDSIVSMPNYVIASQDSSDSAVRRSSKLQSVLHKMKEPKVQVKPTAATVIKRTASLPMTMHKAHYSFEDRDETSEYPAGSVSGETDGGRSRNGSASANASADGERTQTPSQPEDREDSSHQTSHADGQLKANSADSTNSAGVIEVIDLNEIGDFAKDVRSKASPAHDPQSKADHSVAHTTATPTISNERNATNAEINPDEFIVDEEDGSIRRRSQTVALEAIAKALQQSIQQSKSEPSVCGSQQRSEAKSTDSNSSKPTSTRAARSLQQKAKFHKTKPKIKSTVLEVCPEEYDEDAIEIVRKSTSTDESTVAEEEETASSSDEVASAVGKKQPGRGYCDYRDSDDAQTLSGQRNTSMMSCGIFSMMDMANGEDGRNLKIKGSGREGAQARVISLVDGVSARGAPLIRALHPTEADQGVEDWDGVSTLGSVRENMRHHHLPSPMDFFGIAPRPIPIEITTTENKLGSRSVATPEITSASEKADSNNSASDTDTAEEVVDKNDEHRTSRRGLSLAISSDSEEEAIKRKARPGIGNGGSLPSLLADEESALSLEYSMNTDDEHHEHEPFSKALGSRAMTSKKQSDAANATRENAESTDHSDAIETIDLCEVEDDAEDAMSTQGDTGLVTEEDPASDPQASMADAVDQVGAAAGANTMADPAEDNFPAQETIGAERSADDAANGEEDEDDVMRDEVKSQQSSSVAPQAIAAATVAAVAAVAAIGASQIIERNDSARATECDVAELQKDGSDCEEEVAAQEPVPELERDQGAVQKHNDDEIEVADEGGESIEVDVARYDDAANQANTSRSPAPIDENIENDDHATEGEVVEVMAESSQFSLKNDDQAECLSNHEEAEHQQQQQLLAMDSPETNIAVFEDHIGLTQTGVTDGAINGSIDMSASVDAPRSEHVVDATEVVAAETVATVALSQSTGNTSSDSHNGYSNASAEQVRVSSIPRPSTRRPAQPQRQNSTGKLSSLIARFESPKSAVMGRLPMNAFSGKAKPAPTTGGGSSVNSSPKHLQKSYQASPTIPRFAQSRNSAGSSNINHLARSVGPAKPIRVDTMYHDNENDNENGNDIDPSELALALSLSSDSMTLQPMNDESTATSTKMTDSVRTPRNNLISELKLFATNTQLQPALKAVPSPPSKKQPRVVRSSIGSAPDEPVGHQDALRAQIMAFQERKIRKSLLLEAEGNPPPKAHSDQLSRVSLDGTETSTPSPPSSSPHVPNTTARTLPMSVFRPRSPSVKHAPKQVFTKPQNQAPKKGFIKPTNQAPKHSIDRISRLPTRTSFESSSRASSLPPNSAKDRSVSTRIQRTASIDMIERSRAGDRPASRNSNGAMMPLAATASGSAMANGVTNSTTPSAKAQPAAVLSSSTSQPGSESVPTSRSIPTQRSRTPTSFVTKAKAPSPRPSTPKALTVNAPVGGMKIAESYIQSLTKKKQSQGSGFAQLYVESLGKKGDNEGRSVATPVCAPPKKSSTPKRNCPSPFEQVQLRKVASMQSQESSRSVSNKTTSSCPIPVVHSLPPQTITTKKLQQKSRQNVRLEPLLSTSSSNSVGSFAMSPPPPKIVQVRSAATRSRSQVPKVIGKHRQKASPKSDSSIHSQGTGAVETTPSLNRCTQRKSSPSPTFTEVTFPSMFQSSSAGDHGNGNGSVGISNRNITSRVVSDDLPPTPSQARSVWLDATNKQTEATMSATTKLIGRWESPKSKKPWQKVKIVPIITTATSNSTANSTAVTSAAPKIVMIQPMYNDDQHRLLARSLSESVTNHDELRYQNEHPADDSTQCPIEVQSSGGDTSTRALAGMQVPSTLSTMGSEETSVKPIIQTRMHMHVAATRANEHMPAITQQNFTVLSMHAIDSNLQPEVAVPSKVASIEDGVPIIDLIEEACDPPTDDGEEYDDDDDESTHSNPVSENEDEDAVVCEVNDDTGSTNSERDGGVSVGEASSSSMDADELVSKIDNVVHRLIKTGRLNVEKPAEASSNLEQRTLRRNTAELLQNLAILRSRRAEREERERRVSSQRSTPVARTSSASKADPAIVTDDGIDGDNKHSQRQTATTVPDHQEAVVPTSSKAPASVKMPVEKQEQPRSTPVEEQMHPNNDFSNALVKQESPVTTTSVVVTDVEPHLAHQDEDATSQAGSVQPPPSLTVQNPQVMTTMAPVPILMDRWPLKSDETVGQSFSEREIASKPSHQQSVQSTISREARDYELPSRNSGMSFRDEHSVTSRSSQRMPMSMSMPTPMPMPMQYSQNHQQHRRSDPPSVPPALAFSMSRDPPEGNESGKSMANIHQLRERRNSAARQIQHEAQRLVSKTAVEEAELRRQQEKQDHVKRQRSMKKQLAHQKKELNAMPVQTERKNSNTQQQKNKNDEHTVMESSMQKDPSERQGVSVSPRQGGVDPEIESVRDSVHANDAHNRQPQKSDSDASSVAANTASDSTESERYSPTGDPAGLEPVRPAGTFRERDLELTMSGAVMPDDSRRGPPRPEDLMRRTAGPRVSLTSGGHAAERHQTREINGGSSGNESSGNDHSARSQLSPTGFKTIERMSTWEATDLRKLSMLMDSRSIATETKSRAGADVYGGETSSHEGGIMTVSDSETDADSDGGDTRRLDRIESMIQELRARRASARSFG